MQRKNKKTEIKESLNKLKYWLKTFRGKLSILCLIILSIIPLLSDSQYFLYYYLPMFYVAFLYSIFAASWDFLAGFSGQVSFGHAIFFGVAGYGCSYFVKFLGYPFWISLIIGALLSALVGFIIGIPSLRVKGPYLALVTLALNLIILKLFTMASLKDIFFGTGGISNIPFEITDPYVLYYLFFILMVISLIVLLILGKSNFGTILKSMRDDEKGAKASGINVIRYKVIAFTISGFFAGIAGSLYALRIGTVNPLSNFGIELTFMAIIMPAIGGLGTITGGAFGAFFFVFVDKLTPEFAKELANLFPAIPMIEDLALYTGIFFAVILILVIRFAKDGVLKPIIDHLKDLWDLLIGK